MFILIEVQTMFSLRFLQIFSHPGTQAQLQFNSQQTSICVHRLTEQHGLNLAAALVAHCGIRN